MRRIMLGFVGLIVAAVGGAQAATSAQAEPQTAEAFVHGIYDRYIGPVEGTHPIYLDTPAHIRAYFAPPLSELIVNDHGTPDEEPVLDGDPFVDSQEWNMSAFDIKVAQADSAHATATVKFINYGKPDTVRLTLVKLAQGWRIADIAGVQGSLRAIYH